MYFKEIKGKEVTFLNNEKEEFDSVILCTGYKIGIDFLSNDLKKLVFDQDDDSFLNVSLKNFMIRKIFKFIN